MCCQVNVEFRLPVERLAALRAQKVLATSVDRHVRLHDHLAVEHPAADVTRERPLPSVLSLVNLEIIGARKLSAANGTDSLQLPSVPLDVRIPAPFVREHLQTYVAREQFLFRVHSHVLLQSPLPQELPVANGAREIFVIRVDQLVVA